MCAEPCVIPLPTPNTCVSITTLTHPYPAFSSLVVVFVKYYHAVDSARRVWVVNAGVGIL